MDALRLALLEFVTYLADELLEDVLECDEAGGPAELVDDDGQARALTPEFSQRLIETQRLGHRQHATHEVARFRVRRPVDADEVFHVYDAHDVVEIVAIDGEPREAGLPRHRDETRE